MIALENHIRSKPGSEDFRFVKNPGYAGAPTNTDDGERSLTPAMRGSITAKVGANATSREMIEMPVGTRVRRSDGSIWVKRATGFWGIAPDSPPATVAPTHSGQPTRELYVRTTTFEILQIGEELGANDGDRAQMIRDANMNS